MAKPGPGTAGPGPSVRDPERGLGRGALAPISLDRSSAWPQGPCVRSLSSRRPRPLCLRRRCPLPGQRRALGSKSTGASAHDVPTAHEHWPSGPADPGPSPRPASSPWKRGTLRPRPSPVSWTCLGWSPLACPRHHSGLAGGPLCGAPVPSLVCVTLTVYRATLPRHPDFAQSTPSCVSPPGSLPCAWLLQQTAETWLLQLDSLPLGGQA